MNKVNTRQKNEAKGLITGTKNSILDRLRLVLPVDVVNDVNNKLDGLIKMAIKYGICCERGNVGLKAEQQIDSSFFKEN